MGRGGREADGGGARGKGKGGSGQADSQFTRPGALMRDEAGEMSGPLRSSQQRKKYSSRATVTSLRPTAPKVSLEAGPESAEQGLAAAGLTLTSPSFTWKGLSRASPRGHWPQVTDNDL